MEIKSTKSIGTNGVKMLVYGQAGSGKTTLIKTLPKPIIISAEGGMLSLSGYDLPVIEVSTFDDLKQAYEFLAGDAGKKFDSIAIDSISEIGEVVLNAAKKSAKDPRQAYGELAEKMGDLIRAFRDLPKNVYMSAKMEKAQDEMGRILYSPSMPGNKVGQSLPYFFDEVMVLRVEKNDEGKNVRAIQTDGDHSYVAKDRSGMLELWEPADLGAILNKINGVKEKVSK